MTLPTTRWIWGTALLVAVLGSSRAYAEETRREPAALVAPTLDEAVRAGWLTVEARYFGHELQMEVALANGSDQPRVIDVAGRHLEPRTGRRTQRLGMSHPVGDVTPLDGYAEGVFAVPLAAGETRRLLMKCCCMNEERDGPAPGDTYALATEATPATTEVALRWWVAHRAAPQRFVNEAIWRFQPALLDGIWGPTDPRYVPPEGEIARSVNGQVYVLDRGDLARIDRMWARQPLGSGVLQVFPDAWGVHGVRNGTGERELWRFPTEGGEPERLFGVAPEPLLGLWAVPRGPFLWQTERGLFRRAPEGEVRLVLAAGETSSLSVAPVDLIAGTFVVVERRQKGPKSVAWIVHDMDARRGTIAMRKTFWNVRDMAAGPGGVFALSSGGTILRLRGTELGSVARAEGVVRIVAVGRERLVVATDDSGLVAFDLRREAEFFRGTPLETAEELRGPAYAERHNLAFDPVTDDLVWTAGRKVWRLAPLLGQPQVLGVPER